jgi:heat shock protein HspQ
LNARRTKEFYFFHLIKENEKEIVVRSLKKQKLFTLKINRITLYN